jgi:hypothetical protein
VKAMKFMSSALAGLFVVTLAASARADDVSKYFPPQKMAELGAKYGQTILAAWMRCASWL